MPLSGGELASRTEERRVGACFTGSHRGRGRYRYRGRFPVSSHEGIAAEGFDTDPDRDPDPENIFTPATLLPPFLLLFLRQRHRSGVAIPVAWGASLGMRARRFSTSDWSLTV